MDIITRITDLLNDKNLLGADLCRYLEINHAVLTNWKARGTPPPLKYILPICEFLEISPEYLLTGDTTKKVFDKPRVLDDLEEKFLNEFSSLTDLQKGIILGRIEAFNAPQQQKSP